MTQKKNPTLIGTKVRRLQLTIAACYKKIIILNRKIKFIMNHIPSLRNSPSSTIRMDTIY